MDESSFKPSLPQSSVFLFHLGDSQPLEFSSIFRKIDDETKENLDTITDIRTNFFLALKSGDPESGITVCTQKTQLKEKVNKDTGS